MEKVIIKKSIEKFIHWRENNGYKTYDQYNFWSTKYGIWSKKLYYKSKWPGAFFVAPIFMAEIFFPASRKIFSSRKRFPIADAHLILGLLNLYKIEPKQKYIDEAIEISEELIKSSVKGYSGYGWGYPFDWMTTRGLWTSGVPLITTTGYCYEAFVELFNNTNNEKFLTIAKSIFDFTKNDIKDTFIDEQTEVCSYSPTDNSRIVNANAYRSFVLVHGSRLFSDEKALEKAKKNINFIIQSQQNDGSWLYAVNDSRDAFVDNFHTCFVLKNLWKSNLILKDQKISNTIKKGFDFYKQNLLDKEKLPLPFAKLPRINIVKRELYDYAEGITLCNHLYRFDKDAPVILEKLLNEVITNYQKKDGSFVTRVSLLEIRNNIPYLRWAQAQLFFALTNSLTNK